MEGARGWSLGSVEVNKKSSVAWQDWTMLTRIEPMGVQQLRFYGIVWKTHQTWGPRSVSAKKWLEVVQIPKIRVFFEANNLEPNALPSGPPCLWKFANRFFMKPSKKHRLDLSLDGMTIRLQWFHGHLPTVHQHGRAIKWRKIHGPDETLNLHGWWELEGYGIQAKMIIR